MPLNKHKAQFVMQSPFVQVILNMWFAIAVPFLNPFTQKHVCTTVIFFKK